LHRFYWRGLCFRLWYALSGRQVGGAAATFSGAIFLKVFPSGGLGLGACKYRSQPRWPLCPTFTFLRLYCTFLRLYCTFLRLCCTLLCVETYCTTCFFPGVCLQPCRCILAGCIDVCTGDGGARCLWKRSWQRGIPFSQATVTVWPVCRGGL